MTTVTYGMHELAARNQRNTWLLVTVFVLFWILLGFVFGQLVWGAWWAGSVAAGVIAAIVVTIALTRGDDITLGISGAREISHDDAPQLFNVVEEMSIAAGVPMPRVYLINEESPNAFATGRRPDKAAVAITTGLLTKLDRDELQGVMAHELSHVRNRDTLFAVMMGMLVGMVVLLADLFLRSLWYGGGRRRSGRREGGGQAQLIFLVLGILFAILAPLFAKLLQLAVSRQREFLADASAAELTRFPDGLARALEKLASDPTELKSANRATQHLYIVNPLKNLKGGSSSLFSTHPPIGERIARLRAMR